MKTQQVSLPDVQTDAERHYRLAGAHAMAAESKRGTSPADIPGHVAEARGRLIAAAPELLEALRSLLNQARDMRLVMSNGKREEDFAAMVQARAAIAKATGGEA